MLVSQKVTLEIVQTATVTVIDMLSNIGGTLGLFSGFSVISGVEIIYWLAKGIIEEGNKKKKKTKA